MFCFNRVDAAQLRLALAELVTKGLLMAERFAGGYSLTARGFAVMQSLG